MVGWLKGVVLVAVKNGSKPGNVWWRVTVDIIITINNAINHHLNQQ